MTELNNPALMQTPIHVPVQPRPSAAGSVAIGQTVSTASSTLNAAELTCPFDHSSPFDSPGDRSRDSRSWNSKTRPMQKHHHFGQRFGCLFASHEFCRQYDREFTCYAARLSRDAVQREATLVVRDTTWWFLFTCGTCNLVKTLVGLKQLVSSA